MFKMEIIQRKTRMNNFFQKYRTVYQLFTLTVTFNIFIDLKQ